MFVDFSICGLIASNSLITVNRPTYLDNRRSPFWDIYDCATLLAITEPGVAWLVNSSCYTQWCYYLGFHQKSKSKKKKLIKKSRDCYEPLGVLKKTFDRVREFYIELKLGSIGCLREGKPGEKPLQQGKNQRTNLDFGFQSLAGFRTPWAGFWIPKSRIPDSTRNNFPRSKIRITVHGAKCSFPEAETRGPLIFRPKWGQRG